MEEAIRKSEVLIEALPYIKAFREKVIVIKYGGSALVKRKKRLKVLEDIIFMSLAGMRPVIVHGGGPAISRKLSKMGKPQKFIDGFRVTDEDTLAVIDKVLTRLNRQIVKEIRWLGGRSKSVLGKRILRVKKHPKHKKLGLVGTTMSINTDPIEEAFQRGAIPVISPGGRDRNKNLYNVNADQAAASIAEATEAEKLALLTNVDGILKDSKDKSTLIATIKIRQVKRMITRDVIQSGMIPKVKACVTALKKGVKKAHIINGNLSHALLLEIYTDEGIGTEIIKS